MIIKFLLILSWIFSILSLSIMVLKFLAMCYYNSDMNRLDRLQEELRGIRRVFPLGVWPYVFIVTVAYIITYYTL